MLRAAVEVRELLVRDGAFVHECVTASAMAAMGGGMGMCATAPLQPATELVRMPAHAILTTRKARLNLSLIECAARQCCRTHHLGTTTTPHAARSLSVSSSSSSLCTDASDANDEDDNKSNGGDDDDTAMALPYVLPLTAHEWDATTMRRVLGAQRAARVRAVATELQQHLDPTETMVCYLLVLAALYGRWQRPNSSHGACADAARAATSAQPGAATCCDSAHVFCVTHESAWLSTWLHALPAQCDNLLELALWCCSNDCGGSGGGAQDDDDDNDGALASSLHFARHRRKARLELAEVRARYARCVSRLRCLACLPCAAQANEADKDGGDHEHDCTYTHRHVMFGCCCHHGRSCCYCRGSSSNDDMPLPTATTTAATAQPSASSSASACLSSCCACTLTQFVWATNMVMSRGFAFDEEVWALMPYVDYFNYALDANGTMYVQRTPAVRTSCCGGGGDDYTYVFATRAPVRRGEQLCLSYGAYSDYELLLWYGFTMRPSLLPAPPCIVRAASDNDDDDAAAAAAAVAQVCALIGGSDEARRALYAQVRTTASQQLCCSSSDGDDEGDADVAYEVWCVALQRCFSYELAVLASADGSYASPTQSSAAASWLDELIAQYTSNTTRATVTAAAAAPSCTTSDVLRAHSTAEALVWWWPRIAGDVRARCNSNAESRTRCFLGVLGMSCNMREWVRAATHAMRKHGTAPLSPSSHNTTHATRAVMRAHELVRAMAWMELCASNCNNNDNTSHNGKATAATDATRVTHLFVLPAPSTTANVAAAAHATAAHAMALHMSRDAHVLLTCLAVHASEAALRNYVAYDSPY